MRVGAGYPGGEFRKTAAEMGLKKQLAFLTGDDEAASPSDSGPVSPSTVEARF